MKFYEAIITLVGLILIALAISSLVGCVVWPDCEREVVIRTKCEAPRG